MPYIDFSDAYRFDPSSSTQTDDFLSVFSNINNYTIFENTSGDWIVHFVNITQGVSYVAFYPLTTFVPGSNTQHAPPAGVVDAVVLYDFEGNGLHAFYDLGELNLTAADFINNPSLLVSGSDDFLGSAGGDTLYSGASADFLDGDLGNDVLHGQAGDDLIAGSDGTDQLFGEDGADIILGEGDADTINGGEANDTMDGGLGNDSVDGGAGTDLVSYAFLDASVTVSLALQGSAQDTGGSGMDTLVNIEQLEGSSVADTLTGDANANTLYGYSGNDTLIGGGGADTMQGDLGDDTFYVADASDVLVEAAGAGTDTAIASIDYTLGANVENLTLVNALNGTGNDGANSILGNNFNNVLDGGAGADTLTGGIGDDFYIVDDAGDVVVETDTGGFDTIETTIAFTLSPNVEFGLLLAGGTSLTGNSLNNGLTGNSAANTLDGGAGDDNLAGGLGDDTYIVDTLADTIVENAGEGTDTAKATITYTIGANVENLTLLGTGDINGTGNALANLITGNSGANTLDGAGGLDTLRGGLGGDLYIINDANTLVQEFAGEGLDTVHAFVTYTLTDHMEVLALAGNANIDGHGNGQNNIIVGNYGANALYGEGGNDSLSGVGGDDTMYGGLGDDTYVLNGPGDSAIENAGEGVDTIQVGASYTLSDNFENLTFITNGDWNGTGNASNNYIFGSNGANVILGLGGNDALLGWGGADSLVGGEGDDDIAGGVWFDTLEGGAGNDRLDGGADGDSMTGGVGDDYYYVDNTNDAVIENASEGADTISSTIGIFALAANVENLELTGTAINAYGNELNNLIIANGANNFINGGLGADTMQGGAGDDTYLLDNAGDSVTESAGGGTDIIFSSVSINALAQNVENLTISGSAAIATGNSLNNVITGNAGNNTLNGGAGEDTLAGGFGNDTYFVNSAGDSVSDTGGVDTIISTLNVDTALASIENYTLAGTATVAVGNGLNNVLVGNGLANTLSGLDGNDQLNGAAGADTLVGGLGDDSYLVENASDVVIEFGGAGYDTVYAFVSIDALADQVEKLTLMPAGGAIDGKANDLDNRLNGNDSANGLQGLGGNDVINGLGGNDSIIGGAGLDNMWGGAGADTFVYYAVSDSGVTGATRDLINDYVQGEDHIYIGYDPDTANDGIQGMDIIGAAAFTHAPGQLRYDFIDAAGTANDFTLVSLDVNGDAIADTQFTLRGLVALTWADFTP